MADLFLNTPTSEKASKVAGSNDTRSANAPLAERMRPLSLSEYTGQSHILGPGKLLRRAIEADRITSILLFGPPGTGKTSLARIIALSTNAHFEPLSGVENSVADIRRALNSAAERERANGNRTLVFIDEIHRLNKAQQDVLLPDVEKGAIRLIGATTHNPYFVLTSALVSRSQVFQLEPIDVDCLVALQKRALADKDRGLGAQQISADTNALEHLAIQSEGDARKTLNALELAALTTPQTAVFTSHSSRLRKASKEKPSCMTGMVASITIRFRHLSKASEDATPMPHCTGWHGCLWAEKTSAFWRGVS